jgi:D-alanyl-D-alanine dipeptidase
MHPENIPAANFDPSVKERILGDLKKSGPLTPDEVTNRLILRNIMREAGFEPIVNEWWHFDAFPVEITRKIFDIIE